MTPPEPIPSLLDRLDAMHEAAESQAPLSHGDGVSLMVALRASWPRLSRALRAAVEMRKECQVHRGRDKWHALLAEFDSALAATGEEKGGA